LRDNVHIHYGKFGTTKKPVFDIFKQQKLFYLTRSPQHLLVYVDARGAAAKEINKFGVVAKMETDMPRPTRGIVAREDSDTAVDRALKGDTPIEPGPRQRRSSTANPGTCQAPVDE
jgi:hypothetical protein